MVTNFSKEIPLFDSPLVAAVNAPRSSSMPENFRLSSPTRWREPLLSARSSTLCTVLFTVHSMPTRTHFTPTLTTALTSGELFCPQDTEKLLTPLFICLHRRDCRLKGRLACKNPTFSVAFKQTVDCGGS